MGWRLILPFVRVCVVGLLPLLLLPLPLLVEEEVETWLW